MQRRMKFELNVAEDEELRTYIKELIKAAVVNIAREELVEAIKAVAPQTPERINKKIDSTVQSYVGERVRSTFGGTYNDTGLRDEIKRQLRAIVREEVDTTLKKLVEDIIGTRLDLPVKELLK